MAADGTGGRLGATSVDDARPAIRSGEREPEARRAVRGADADLPTVQLDEPLHDGEPAPGAATRAVPRALDAEEAIEHVGQVGGGDPVTAVRDAHEGIRGAC